MYMNMNPDAREMIACAASRFWLGALTNKGGRGQGNREEIGATRGFRGFAARAPGDKTGDKTAMLRRLAR